MADATDTHDATVLILVGTDFHPFDRLLEWMERWFVSAADRPSTLVQYGRGRRPIGPAVRSFLNHHELQQAIANAQVVVTHGGPATIMEIRQRGLLPIVVPRDPRLGEHVDSHQQLFSRRLADAGLVWVCESEDELVKAIDQAIADPAMLRISSNDDTQLPRHEAVARVGQIIEELIAGRRPRKRTRRRKLRTGAS